MVEPVRLGELLAEIGRLYATVRQDRDRKSVKALGEKLIALRKRIDEDILATLNIVNDDGELDSGKLDQWNVKPDEWRREKLAKVDEKVVLEESEELSKFFANVSNSVIDAQKNLNRFSKDYVKALDDPRVLPTYFAIPSIRAEMKLGFSELTSRGINVILFKSKSQQERYIESTITFELVSTPPVSAPPPPTNTPRSAPPPGPPVPELVGMLGADFPTTGAALEPGAETESPVAEEEPAEESVPEGVQDSENEEADELRQTLRDARAALFAATDRLVEKRKEFEERAEAAAAARAPKTETPLVTGEELSAVLDLIASRHESGGARLEEIFVASRGDAIALKYDAEGVTRYLVLWPGRSESAGARGWGEMRVYDLAVRRDGELALDGGVFTSAPKEGYLSLGSRSKLLRLKKEEMADLTASLGDALMIVTNVLGRWAAEVSRRD